MGMSTPACRCSVVVRGHNTLIIRAPRAFVDSTLWPEYLELQAALHAYINEATERIIQEEVYGDAGEANERTG